MINVRKSFSRKLSLGVLLLAMLIFTASLGILFTQSRYMIRGEAVGRANSVLNATMQRLSRNLMAIETATNINSWLIEKTLVPDTLLAYSNRIVRLNPHIDGCSISTEPDVFPKYGRYFSVYTVRETDTIRTVIEAQYEYFDKVWYKKPRELNRPCWVAYFDEADSLELTLDGMAASYSRPLYSADSSFVGIISTDLSLLRLSKAMSQVKPYPHSYFMMIDEEGRFFIHPDSTRLFYQTIFSNIDPRQQADLIALGHEMTAGNEGNIYVNIDGEPCLVCYMPVPGTTWSLAIVCTDSDVLAGYHRLTYILVPLLVIGLLIILLLCNRAISQSMRPLYQLLEKTQSIAEGNMDVYIPTTKREDIIGSLQNSFATMLQSINIHMGNILYTTEATQRRNEELAQATRLVKEADRQKTAFIQNVSHQIRTPLNIIMGFAQVFGNTQSGLVSDEEERKSIAETMDYNTRLLNRMLQMLFDSSDTGLNEELNCKKQDKVSCNEIANEAIVYIKLNYPGLQVNLQTNVDDDFCIVTNHLYLMRTLRELLYNSAKYSDGQHILLSIKRTESTIQFIVEDTGKGIVESDRDLIFKSFTKVDDLSEGLGLGLPLAKRHACTLGGDLILDDSYHDGCRFILEFPLEIPLS